MAGLGRRAKSSFGDYSDEVVMNVDGSPRRLTIYHRYVDDLWSEYTAVLDDGTVLSRNRSLRHLLLDDVDEADTAGRVSIPS